MKEDIFHLIDNRFKSIYGKEYKANLIPLVDKIQLLQSSRHNQSEKWSEKDIYLITYGDSIRNENEKPLLSLKNFLQSYAGEAFSHVHILPFFPYSSDDGFSVINYREVNPSLGTWTDIMELGKSHALMLDLVINHISKQSVWFKNFLINKSPGAGYFITIEEDTDLSNVVRPRSLPLLTVFNTILGEKKVWTTFSSDQVDLNFMNPAVLLEILDIFLFYIEKGARVIRLDAIAYLWKQIGTSCIHLPQTHEIVKLMRVIKDIIDPGIILITETNVPNQENLSYLGSGDEADMIYQFSLPPLLLHALYSGFSGHLNHWLASLDKIPEDCSFFNFTASHDGIGVRPLEGLLPDTEIMDLTKAISRAGGYISTRRNSNGTDSPYEMNITYFDAVKYTFSGIDSLQVDRFIASQTIMMALKGVPAFYIHSLLGTENATEEVKKTGMPRSINRKKWNTDQLYPLLTNDTNHKKIMEELLRRIIIRRGEVAFHPATEQRLLVLETSYFAFFRGNSSEMAIIANLQPKTIRLDFRKYRLEIRKWIDLLTDEMVVEQEILFLPYQVRWLKNKG